MKFLKYTLCLIAATILSSEPGSSCTNILVSKGATTDGSAMISYAADSHVLYGELYHYPAKKYNKGEMLNIYEWDTGEKLGQIAQADETYNVVGNMNEYQLAIGETTYGGRPELVDTTGIIDYGSLIYITLQRAKTAREAIILMGKLVEEYGYYSSGESFSVSDPNEVWILEMIGKGTKLKQVKTEDSFEYINENKGAVWVALRLPEGTICAHANQSRITTFPKNDPENCLYAPDVISFAKEMGYYEGSDDNFSFCDAYAPLNFEGARFCEARVWAVFNRVKEGMDQYTDYAMGENLENKMPLFVYPDEKLSVKDVMELMRDYYQNTPLDMTKDIGAGPYSCIVRWRPLTWEVDSITYFNERAISTQQTGFSFVAQSRRWLPDPVGGILWFGVDDTYSTVYNPMYCGITKIPENYAVGNGDMMDFSETSAFWIFNQVSNFAYTRYSYMSPEIREKQAKLEDMYITKVKETDKKASEVYKKDKNAATEIINDFSNNMAANTFKEWKALYYHLFTKYMDGNIKYKVEGQQNPRLEQPGYSEDWYREIVKKTGDKFKVHGEVSH